MTELSYMSLDIKAFLADTTRLSAAQSWAYLAIIADAWLNKMQPPPDDDAALARIARVSPAEWRRIRPALEPFFDVDESGKFRSWRNHGAEKRYDEALARHLGHKRGGVLTSAARWGPQSNKSDADPPDGSATSSANSSATRSATSSPSRTASSNLKVKVKVKENSKKEAAQLPESPRARPPENHWETLEKQLRCAAKLEEDPSPGLLNVGPIAGLLEAGYDLGLDVLPVLRSKSDSGHRPRSWSYFVDAIRDARASRASIAGTPAPAVGETDAHREAKWRSWYSYWKSTGQWHMEWGPRPDTSSCWIPTALRERWDHDVA